MKVTVLKDGLFLNESLKAVEAKSGDVIEVPFDYGNRLIADGYFLKFDETSPEQTQQEEPPKPKPKTRRRRKTT